MNYIRRRVYHETGYYGWNDAELQDIEIGAIQKQTAIAKSILENENNAYVDTLDRNRNL